MNEEKRVVRLDEVDIPESFYERIRTGSDPLDIVLGGEDLPGMMPATSWLVTGTPGAGKSTLLMQILAHMGDKERRSCLLNSGEESVQRVAHRGRRLRIKMDAFSVSTFTRVDELETYVIDNLVDVLVVDSLQALADGDEEMQVHGLVQRLKELTKHGVTVLMIGHVTKSGAFAGKNRIEHDVDAHIKIGLNKDTGNRVIYLPKNRVGPAGIPYEFTMTAEGLDLRRIELSEGPDKGGRRPSPGSQEFTEAVRALLLRGEKLCGYSHDDYEELRSLGRSGGFMRAALARVSKDLEREGFIVMQATIGGRLHTYIDGPPVEKVDSAKVTQDLNDGGDQ